MELRDVQNGDQLHRTSRVDTGDVRRPSVRISERVHEQTFSTDDAPIHTLLSDSYASHTNPYAGTTVHDDVGHENGFGTLASRSTRASLGTASQREEPATSPRRSRTMDRLEESFQALTAKHRSEGERRAEQRLEEREVYIARLEQTCEQLTQRYVDIKHKDRH